MIVLREIILRKIIKRTAAVIAVIIVLFTGLGLFSCVSMLAMKPAETGLIPGTGIYAVKNNRNNMYFIKTDSGYIMVDAGSNSKTIEASVNEAGIDVNDVKWILLTHSDYDHVAGLHLFPNAGINMSEDEFPLINGTIKRNVFTRNKLPSGIDINTISLLRDNQELSFNGTSIRCIKAPGHTNGSMLFLVDGRYLFTGDAFKVTGGKTGVHPFTMDAKLAKKTIEQLEETINGSAIVLTSHYGLLHQ